MPVDWWDEASQVWRCTVIDAGDELPPATRTHVCVVAPFPDRQASAAITYVPQRVAITDLRPSRLVTDRIAQFFTTRYTLEMLDALMPCIERASQHEQAMLRRVLNELIDLYSETYDIWAAAYYAGADRDDPGSDWRPTSLDRECLPRRRTVFFVEPRHDVFAAIEAERRDGEISCCPVAMWDENADLWRPTMLLGATGSEDQFSPSANVSVLIPGHPVATARVAGSLLEPLDIADTCFSLFAIPVLARDLLRMQEGLEAAGFTTDEVLEHPFMVSATRMLSGAAGEWRLAFDLGLDGPPPEPRVALLEAGLWGCSSDDIPSARKGSDPERR